MRGEEIDEENVGAPGAGIKPQTSDEPRRVFVCNQRNQIQASFRHLVTESIDTHLHISSV